MKIQSLFSKSATMLALAALLTAPVMTPSLAFAKDKKPKIDLAKLAWPPPPDVARIRFVTQFTGDDIKGVKKQGLLERLAGVPEAMSRDRMKKPYGIAVDSTGRVYVADTILRIVFAFDMERKTVEYRGDKPPAAFKKPLGVAVDAKDRLYVSDSELHNITCFTPTGDVVGVFGEDELVRPAGMAVDSTLNRLYVADVKSRKVAVYDTQTLKFVKWIGKSSDEKLAAEDAEKMLMSPTNIAVDPDGLIYVVDTFMNRVTVFDSDGEPVRRLGGIGSGAGHFMRPRGIAFDSDGHVYVVDAMANSFQILTPDGKALMPIGGTGMSPGQFNVPADIAIDKDNRIFVTDQANARVQVFRYVTDNEAATESGKASEKAQQASAESKK